MASALSWLAKCKASQLKAIAHSTGIQCSGTKSVLAARLLAGLQCSRFELPDHDHGNGSSTPQHNIVSIDMGIRNLAYCRLTLPSGLDILTPDITEWKRITVSRASPASLEPKEKEAFDPATYSQRAHALVTSLLSPHPPTQILIERQRFRSMGGSSVQEWTLRVNMFEAMLYAVLKTLSAQGLWKGAVHPVAPAMVSKFWLGKEEAGEGKMSKSAKTKLQKVELVKKWLEEDGGRMKFEASAKETARKYLEKRKGGRKGTKIGQPSRTDRNADEGEIGKLDDLADCLLQGMAWISWEENRRTIVSQGLSNPNNFN